MTESYPYLNGECKYDILMSFFFFTLTQTFPQRDILDKYYFSDLYILSNGLYGWDSKYVFYVKEYWE